MSRFYGSLCIYILGALAPPTEFCPVQSSLCVQVLRSPILATLLHGTGAVGVSQTLRRGTRNGITELSLFNRGRHLYSEGGHHLGHRPTFYFFLISCQTICRPMLSVTTCKFSLSSIACVKQQLWYFDNLIMLQCVRGGLNKEHALFRSLDISFIRR